MCVRTIQKRASATGKEIYEIKFCSNWLEVATIKFILAGQMGFFKARIILLTVAPMQWPWKMASKTVAANNDYVMGMGGGNGSDNGTDKGDGAGSAMRRGEAIKGGGVPLLSGPKQSSEEHFISIVPPSRPLLPSSLSLPLTLKCA